MTRCGFFGGSFDPIHLGHLNLAISLFECHALDEILFCPAHFSPEKAAHPPHGSSKARKEMIDLAIEAVPGFSSIDNELRRKGPSYTIDTIRELQSDHPDKQFFLLLAEDVIGGLNEWKEIEELFRLARPLIGTRAHNLKLQPPNYLKEAVEQGVTPIPTMEISSTEVRNRLFEKKICTHLVPTKVLDYIRLNRIY